MAAKKYELTTETLVEGGVTLHRIRALRSFEIQAGDKTLNVEAGDLGGYVEKAKNLAQAEVAWVSGEARIFGTAKVSGSAHVSGKARVY